MRASTIARSYAEALFELGENHDESDRYAVWLEELAGAIGSSPTLRAFLATPKVARAAKQAALRDALATRVSPMFLNFLMVVVRKGRQEIFREIASEYRAILDRKLGRLHVDVTLAHTPDAEAERNITEQLSGALGKTVIPHVRVEPQILGGVIVRYGDRVLDGSIRRQLVALRSRMLHAELPAPGAGPTPALHGTADSAPAEAVAASRKSPRKRAAPAAPTLTRGQALEILEVDEDADSGEIRSAYEELFNEFRIRVDNAPTPALKKTYQERLTRLDDAIEVLGGRGAAAAYTDLPASGRVADADGDTTRDGGRE